MANLELDIFTIHIKKIKSNDLIHFGELFGWTNDDLAVFYTNFIQGFYKYFDSSFIRNKENNKAITASQNLKNKLRMNDYILDFELLGGPTNVSHDLYKIDNAKDPSGKIQRDDVAGLNFYVKLWTPINSDTGLLMIQYYSNSSITQLIKTNLREYFKTYDMYLYIDEYIPKEIIEDYKKNSRVTKVQYVKVCERKKTKENLNGYFAEFDQIKIKVEVSGFGWVSVNEFVPNFLKGQKANIADLEITDEDYEVTLFYEDRNKRKTSANISKKKNITPTFILPEDLTNSDGVYDFTEIINYTDELLEKVKKELFHD